MATPSPKRLPITVLIPCFNEEHKIEACLSSVVGWVDEILVVDSFSTDRTVELAKKYTDRVLQHEYLNSAAQKNWAIPQASHEWVLIVDSDERVTPELRDELQALMARGPDKDGYWIARDNYLFGKHIRHSGWGRDAVLRFFKRDLGRYAEKRVHAEVELNNTGVLQGRFEHHTVASITAWAQKINRYSSWKAQDKFEKGVKHPVLNMVLRPPLRFFKDMVLRLGVLDGWRGFLIASMSAFAELLMSAKIIELQHNARERRP